MRIPSSHPWREELCTQAEPSSSSPLPATRWSPYPSLRAKRRIGCTGTRRVRRAPSTGRSGCSARAQEIRSETRTGNGGRRLVWRSAQASTTIKGAQSRNPSPRGMVVASPISWARLGSALKSAATAATGYLRVLLSGSVDVLPEQDRAAPAHDRRRPVRRHSPGLVQTFHAARCGHHSGAPDRVGGENTTPASRHPCEGPITRQMCRRAPASRVLSAAGRMAGPGAVLQVALRLGGYICQMSHDDMYRCEWIVVVRCCSLFEPFGVCDGNLVPAQENVHDLFAGRFIAVQVRMANSLHCFRAACEWCVSLLEV